MNSADKRQTPRINIKQTISFGNEHTIELIEVHDISTEGIAFFANEKIEKGSSIYLLFPGNEQIKENELQVTVWNCDATNVASRPFKISAVFVDANLKYLEDIKRLYGKTN